MQNTWSVGFLAQSNEVNNCITVAIKLFKKFDWHLCLKEQRYFCDFFCDLFVASGENCAKKNSEH